MAEVSLNWCAVLLLLAIALKSAVSSDTDISYQVGQFNNKLSALQDRLNVFDYITVLMHRIKYKDLSENVTVHMNETNRKLANLEDKIDALTLDVSKQDDLESKFNVFATRVTSNVSETLHRLEEKESQNDEYAKMHMNESNRKLANLEDKIDTRLTDLESKLNTLATTVTSNMSSLLHQVEEKDSKGAENEKLQNQVTNAKLDNLVSKVGSFASVDTRLTDLESKLNAMAASLTNFVGYIEGALLKPLSSCADAFARPLSYRVSGVYNILPFANSPPFKAYCMADPKGGQAWTVVQRRVDGSVDFYRNWTEYQRGFGDLEGNLWIGLDNLHLLTTKGEPQELWVMLTDRDGNSTHAYYDRFAIGNEADKYPLEVLGKYSGDAGDSLTGHKSMKFSTYDNDQDASNSNCAKVFKSAWWFYKCLYCDLNAVYGDSGMYWSSFNVFYIKYAHMAIRPARK